MDKELFAPVVSQTKIVLALSEQVHELLAHAKTKTTMGHADDVKARPLIELLRQGGHIRKDDGAFVEWQSCWEHDLVSVFHGDDHCLNVHPDGRVEEIA
jgi:hypothetical protein